MELYLSKEWGTVANDGSWTLEDGEVIFRQLGYEIARIFDHVFRLHWISQGKQSTVTYLNGKPYIRYTRTFYVW